MAIVLLRLPSGSRESIMARGHTVVLQVRQVLLRVPEGDFSLSDHAKELQ